MAKQSINVGTTANDKKGDSLRAAFQKVNSNFTELYEAVGLSATGQDTTLTFVGSTLSTDDSSAITIDQAVTVSSNLTVGGDILPSVANGGDLGSPAKPWRSLYVSNNTIYIGGTAVGLDANGNLTVNGSQVTGGGVSTLVNGANTVSLGSTGILTLPNGVTIRDNASYAVAIGAGAGANTQGEAAVAFGLNAGANTQGAFAVAIGAFAGSHTQGNVAVAIGESAGNDTQGNDAVAIGAFAGSHTQGNVAVAIGAFAGSHTQGNVAVAIGAFAGNDTQGEAAVAIGVSAGNDTQGNAAVAIGNAAGNITQGQAAVAIGQSAGADTQGANAVAIGRDAGLHNQAANSIVINATGVTLDNTTENSLVVAPIRNVGGTSGVLQYNAATKEVSYSSDIRSEGNINIDINLTDSTLRRWSFGEDGDLTLPAGGDIKDSTGASVLGGGSSIPTVVTTGAVGVNGAAHAKVQFTVTSATAVTAVGVTAIGVTDSTKGTITLSGSPGTGAFDIVAVTNTFPGEYYILMPFATNASGTGYGAPISGEGTNPCLVRGTMITMADMSRVAVENITYSDDILVWDFDLGEFASAKPLWIKKTQTTVVSCLLTFSDHSELQIVGDSPKAHRIFNKEAGKFTYGSMPETPIGTTTFNDQGEEITLVSKEWIVGEVEFYNVITDYHMNLFANSILTSMRYNNLYPITDMKFVKDSRTLRTADDYPNVEERLYKGFRLAEQTHGVEEIETHIQWLLTFEVERETECV